MDEYEKAECQKILRNWLGELRRGTAFPVLGMRLVKRSIGLLGGSAFFGELGTSKEELQALAARYGLTAREFPDG